MAWSDAARIAARQARAGGKGMGSARARSIVAKVRKHRGGWNNAELLRGIKVGSSGTPHAANRKNLAEMIKRWRKNDLLPRRRLLATTSGKKMSQIKPSDMRAAGFRE